MGIPVEINNLILGSLGGYTVGRSLRFRSSASAYLNRTQTAGSQTTWTWSGWVKRGKLTTSQYLMQAGGSSGSGVTMSVIADDFQIETGNGTTQYYARTTAQYRDPSAWYHVVMVCNTTSATSTLTGTPSDRLQIWINGVQVTSFSASSIPTQNFAGYMNQNTVAANIGRWNGASPSYYYDGYLAEVNFIDGQALTPSSFGAYDTNGVWQPKKYSGTYGTNGFYLPFSNTTSTTTLVADSSGNGNNWTPNNISLTAGTTYDSMIDSPTNAAGTSTGIGNYAVLNPLIPANSGFTNTFSEANQNGTITGTGGSAIFSSITMSSGSWYWETYVVNVGAGTNIDIGICSTAYPPSTMSNANGAIGGKAGGYSIFNLSGASYKANNNVATAYGVTYTNGDTIMTAFDATNGKIWFGKNGTWMASGDPATAANPTFSSIPSDTYWAGFGCAGGVSRTVQAVMNFGQRPFSYTPPSGYKALNTYNLPAPSIANGAQYMAASTWTGDGTSPRTFTNGGNNTLGTTFQPDLVWIKMRSGAYQHVIADSVRGGNAILHSNSTSAEDVNWQYGYLQSFNSNGFTAQSGSTSIENINLNGSTFVGWQWKAGAGTTSTNTSGSITSTVSANTTAGFSVVTYTGNSLTNQTVGHGLGVAPSMIIIKNRDSAYDWIVGHTSTSFNGYLYLNSTGAYVSSSNPFNNTAPTSTVFTIAGNAANPNVNLSTTKYVAYCFAAVSGYSAFGSYTGNGSTDGPFVYTGFRPRWLMIKRTDSSTNGDWRVFDTSRATYNVVTPVLFPNGSFAEDTSVSWLDILSNGFKLKDSGASSGVNATGGTFVYAVFAENPFNYSRAR